MNIRFFFISFFCAVPAYAEWNFEKELKCLADNIYHEARGEGIDGQKAVAHVTMNRVDHPYYPNTVCEVVWEKRKSKRTKKWVAQFSWTLDGKSDKIRDQETYAQIKRIAYRIMVTNPPDITSGATHYHNDEVSPRWAKKLTMTKEVDKHTFYR